MKHFRFLYITTAATVFFAACGGDPPGVGAPSTRSRAVYDPANDPLINTVELSEPFPADHPELANEEATLIRTVIGEPRTINPFFANSWFDFYFGEMLFDYLVRRHADMIVRPSGRTVLSHEESDDHMVITLHLNPEMKWQDGVPVTAHDVVFSWEAITNPDVPAVYWKYTASQLAKVEAIDDHTVRYTQKQSTPLAWTNLRFPFLPKHLYDIPEERAKDPSLMQSEYYTRLNREVMTGNGPYKFVEWLTNDRLIVERWDDYPFEKPHFKRVIVKVQPDRNIALLLFKGEEAHEYWLTPQQFATQTNDEQFAEIAVKSRSPRRMIGYIGWNQDGSNPFFQDPAVRRALAHAYDKERVLRDVVYNLYTPSKGIFDPSHWAYNPDVDDIKFDLDRAATLLDEAGWKISPEDGWRYKEIDGKPVKFDFELVWAQSFADATKMSNIYLEDLKRIGIAVRTRIIENAAFDNMNIKHEFEAHVSVWEVSADPDQWWNHYHSSESDGGRNYYSYKNAEVDALFEQARRDFGQDERAASYSAIQKILYDEQAVLFMWDYTMLHAFNKKLGGVELAPSGAFLFYPGHRKWWLRADLPLD